MVQEAEARKAPERRSCAECGAEFEITDPVRQKARRFCSVAHKQDFANRQTARGKVLAASVLAWRAKRGSGDVGKAALAELCSIADQFNEEDRKAGRPAVADYFASLDRQGYRYIDRQRRRSARVRKDVADRKGKGDGIEAKTLPVA